MVHGLYDCFKEANLSQYVPNFYQQGVCSLDSLAGLTMQDYTQFGITDLDDKKRLFRLIHIIKSVQLNKERSPEGSRGKKAPLDSNDNHRCAVSGLDASSSRGMARSSEKASAVGKNKRISAMTRSLPRKKGESLLDAARHDLKKGALSPGTLRKLESNGGILFVKSTTASPGIRRPDGRRTNAGKKLQPRESLSDSEVASSSRDLTRAAPPILRKSFIEVIDHGDSSPYDYGIPSSRASLVAGRHHGTIVGDNGDRIRVCVRKRPLSRREARENEVDVVQTEGQGTIVVNESKVAVDLTKFMQVHKYHFDEVFGDSCSNEEVYSRTAKPLIATMFKRGKSTCFAYGQTGAGKTHTMLGHGNVRGLYLLAAEDIFTELKSADRVGDKLAVWASYFEIYCGNLFDLLNNRQRVHAREDSQHCVCIAGLSEVAVSGPESLMQVVDQGNKLRSQGASGVNTASSRSHAILQLQLQDGGRHKLGRFSFIDLAGSERACDTTDPDRVTRYEGAEINTSLLALKECIRALDQDQRHTPFRQSKLTQVLRDSFLGHSKTCMIANIAPNSSAIDHTLNTLRYADRVKELKKETCNTPTPQYPSTPNTFSPGNTSTPLKTPTQSQSSKNSPMLSTPQSTKGGNPVSASSGRKLTSVRKVAAHRGDSDKADTRSSGRTKRQSEHHEKSSESSHNKRNEQLSTLAKEKPPGTVGMPDIKGPDSAGRSARKALNVTFERQILEEDAKARTKEAFLQGKPLPVWYPPKALDQPKERAKTQGDAWDIENPMYVLSPKMRRARASVNPRPRQEESGEDNLGSPSPKTPPSNKNEASPETLGESGIFADDEMVDNWSRRNDSSDVHRSLQMRHCTSEESCSTDTDGTMELLAEIDHALRNSLVSPLSDSSEFQVGESNFTRGRANKSGDIEKRIHPSKTHSKPEENPAVSLSLSSSASSIHNLAQSSSRPKDGQAMSLHPEIHHVDSQDSMSIDSLQDLEAARLVDHRRQVASKSNTDQHGESPPSSSREDSNSTFRSKLTILGIESLPSPRDIQRVTPNTIVGERHQDNNSLKDKTPRVHPNNPSGVLVSTSFQEYVGSTESHRPPNQSQQLSVSMVETTDCIRPSPIGQNRTIPSRGVVRGTSLNLSTAASGVQSPVTREVLLKDRYQPSAFSQVSSTPNKAFTKESLGNAVSRESSNASPPKPQGEKESNDGSGQKSTDGLVPRLQLVGVVGRPHGSRGLLLPRQNSAIDKAKDLLLSAHAEQIGELERLCESEWQLIKQLHNGEKGLSEYLQYAKHLMSSKLRCIDTFQDQLSSFSRCSTPDASPRSRSPMEAW